MRGFASIKQGFLDVCIPVLIMLLQRFLAWSIRWTVLNRPENLASCSYIVAFWHARLLMLCHFFPGCRPSVLISEHQDGAYIAKAIHYLGFDAVRGSSSRNGLRALLKMMRLLQSKNTIIGISPDGPRGPREQVSAGTVVLARLSGVPILPLCYATSSCWRASSWDRFYIPKPFSRGVCLFGEPLWVARHESIEQAQQRLQRAMDDLQQKADAWVRQ